jgi:transketolase
VRKIFFETLAELGQMDRRVLLLTADLGFLAIEPFVQACPRQFFNVGVSEQNMIGLATGLAEAGYLPFVYSIAPFAVLRPYEFIRNGPIAHRLPVRVVSVGGGVEYATCGISHYGLEDIGVLRVQPNFPLVTPADSLQARSALKMLWNSKTPLYFRLSKNDQAVVHDLNGRFTPGVTQMLREGRDVLLLALGPAVQEALAAATLLNAEGVSARVELIDHLNGPELTALPGTLRQFSTIVTVERHYVNGGLGSFICEIVAERGYAAKAEGGHAVKVVRCAFSRLPDGVIGDEAFLLNRYGLSAESIAHRTIAALRGTD